MICSGSVWEKRAWDLRVIRWERTGTAMAFTSSGVTKSLPSIAAQARLPANRAFDALGLCGEKEPREGVVLKVITEESH